MFDNNKKPDYIIQLDCDMMEEAVTVLEKIKEKYPGATIYIEVYSNC